MADFMSIADWSPLWLSLKTGAFASLIAFILGIYFARLSMRFRRIGRAVMDGILTLPLVLPPTASGFLLLLLFSLKRTEDALQLVFDVQLIDSWKGCLAAATVIAFPLMYRSVRDAFEKIDENLLFAGKTLGMKKSTVFWKVIIPASAKDIAAGIALAFVRAVGEYGATAMLVANTLGRTRTLPLAIASGVQSGDYTTALAWSIISLSATLLFLILFNILSGRGMKARRWI